MARGVGAQILLLALCTMLLVAITMALLIAFDVVPANEAGQHDSKAMLAWKSLMHTLDAGTLGGDAGSWTFLFVFLFATIGGIFVVSALIGVLNQGFGTMLDSLRRGRSTVVERGHTVILGWGPKIGTLLHELAEANRNQRDACVVILADRDKVDMDAEVSEALEGARLRVVTRRGSPMSMADVAVASLSTSKAVIVLAPEYHPDGSPMSAHESDTVVLKTLLAVTKVAAGHELHVVAEIFDERTETVARMVAGDKAALILAAPLVSRLLVQTGRQSGLSVVYSELLDFAGVEIYVTPATALLGKTFREAVLAYGTSSVIGVLTGAGEMLLPAPFDHKLAAGDHIVAISEDDDTLVLDGAGPIDEAGIATPVEPPPRAAERTLILGTSPRLPIVLRELDNYVAPGSETLVYGERGADAIGNMDLAGLRNMRVAITASDVTERTLLESLDVSAIDHVLVLSETQGRTQDMADARTTVTLLHLRDLARRAGKSVPITSEILEIQSRDLAAVAEADDFIVSNTLVSLMVSQVAENPHLVRVFDELFTAGGHELYLKSATDYVESGPVTFATVCEAAMRRGHVAIGYRLLEQVRDPAAAFGVVVNPNKRDRLRLGAGDKIIVLAES